MEEESDGRPAGAIPLDETEEAFAPEKFEEPHEFPPLQDQAEDAAQPSPKSVRIQLSDSAPAPAADSSAVQQL